VAKPGATAITVPEWFAKELDRHLKETKDTRYQSKAELLVAAWAFWVKAGGPEINVKRGGRWEPPDKILRALEQADAPPTLGRAVRPRTPSEER
jgi:hypothetical protein